MTMKVNVNESVASTNPSELNINVDKNQFLSTLKALKSLSSNDQTTENNLIEEDNLKSTLYLIVTLQTMSKKKILPLSVKLPHPIFPSTVDTTLFVKDAETKESLKSGLANQKVVTIKELRESYRTFESKRHLASSSSLFYCDKNITSIISPHLGKAFYSKKKFPIGVTIPKTFKLDSEQMLSTTQIYIPDGATWGIKFADIESDQKDIYENFVKLLDYLKLRLTKDNLTLKTLSVKLTNTTSLPIYSSLLE